MTSDTDLEAGAAEWGMLVALSLVWALSFYFYKVLTGVLAPFTVVFGRVAIAAAALWLVLAARGERPPADGRTWAGLALLGLLANVVPFTLIAASEARISSGLASILNATTPMFTVLVAHAFTRDERLTAAKAAALGLGVAGVAALVGPAALQGAGGDAWACVAVLGASASYGFAAVFGRRFHDLPPLTLATGQLTASAVLTLPLMLAFDRPWRLPPPGPGAWAALVGLALLSSALAYILYFRILQRAGATAVSLVTLLIPVSAVLLGWAALGERLAPSAWAGMALIGLGLGALNARSLGRLRPRLA